jgi:integrase
MGRKTEWKIVWRNGWAYAHGRFRGEKIRQALKTKDKDTAELRFQKVIAPYTLNDQMEAEHLVLRRITDAQAKMERAENADREAVTVADAFKWYSDHPEERPQALPVTLRDYRYQWEKFTAWTAAHRPHIDLMHDVTGEDAAAFARWLARNGGLSNNRYKKVLATAKRFFKYLLPHRPNPFNRVDVFQKNVKAIPNSRRALTRAEMQIILSTAKGEWLSLMALGYYTGMRLGDCATLRWDEISLELGRITRQPNKTRRSSGKVVIITIHPDLRRHLLLTPVSRQRGYVVPSIADQYHRDRTRVSKQLTRFFEDDCKISTTEQVPGCPRLVKKVDFHSLRHTFATEAHRHGADQATLEALLGHGSPVLQRLYVHVGQTAILNAIEGLPTVNPAPATPAALPAPETVAQLLTKSLATENVVDIKELIIKALSLL